jgi:translation initiation factor 2 subunit 1
MSNEAFTPCRMYEARYPAAEDFVLVKVKNVSEMGAYVELLEYSNIEGMILMSELSRRRIRSINKLICVGRIEVVVVMRVDNEKGYIDLSKRRVSPEDIANAEAKYNKSKAVHSILQHASGSSGIRMEDLYTTFGWDLYKRFGHVYDAFRLMVTQAGKVLEPYHLGEDPALTDAQKDAWAKAQDTLLKDIKTRLTPHSIKMRADVEVTCFAYEGIDAIKEAFLAAEALSTPNLDVKIKLVAPPLYIITTHALEKEQGLALHIKTPPRAVFERDNRLLSLLLETLERQNQQVDGDADADE